MKQNEIPYQFAALPINLTACMDNNCRSMLFTLLQLSTYFENRKKEENKKWDGWFFRSNADLQAESRLSDKVVRAVISTFHRIGILEVNSVGQSRGAFPNYFRLNTSRFVEWEKMSLEDCVKNPNYAVKTDNYKQKGWNPSYVFTSNSTNEGTTITPESSPSPHNIDNIANVENIDNKLSAGAHERVSTKSRDFHSPEMAEYKQRENGYMKHLSEVKYWCDFLIVAPKIADLLKDAKTDKVRAYTTQRYQSVVKSRIAFFTKKFQADPYQPEAKTFFAWLEKHPQWQ